MELDRSELIKVLEDLKPGLETEKGYERQTTHFIFNKTHIYTYNERIMVSQKYRTGIKGTVKGEKLLKILGKLPDEEIDVAQGENQLLITGERRKSGLALIPEIEIDVPFEIKEKEWFRLPGDFLEGLAFCAFSASKNTMQGPLTCIKVEGGRMVSCDAYRMTMYRLDNTFEFSFLIPRSAAEELPGYAPTLFTRTENWLHFKGEGGDVVFSCQAMDEKYPAVDGMLEFESRPAKFPDELRRAIETASVFATADPTQRITLKLRGDTITCIGRGDEGFFQEEADMQYGGKPTAIIINPVFLNEILKHVTKVKIGEEKLLFRSSKFQHVLALYDKG